MSDLIVHERPELRSPRMLVAFGGWPDAAAVATRAVQTLVEQLGASRFAEIPGDDFFSPAVLRPITAIRDGRIESLAYPANEFRFWRSPGGAGDLILLAGIEPHVQWRRYVDAILDLAADRGVTQLYALGGLYDGVPHTRPVRVSAVVEDQDLRRRLSAFGVRFSDYEGPSSLHTTLLMRCRARRLVAASLWGHVPSYAQLSWNPRVTAGLLELLVKVLEVEVDLEPLRVAATYLDEALDKLGRQNPQVQTLIRRLEESYEASGEPASTQPISDSILREVEEILRRGEARSEDSDSSSSEPEV